jgi:hypothetical protein
MRGPAFGRSAAAGSGARGNSMDQLNDAASVSSMESYGYSLDGYAPSTATPVPRDYNGHPSSSAGGAGLPASGSGPLARAGALNSSGGAVDVDDSLDGDDDMDDMSEPEGAPVASKDP